MRFQSYIVILEILQVFQACLGLLYEDAVAFHNSKLYNRVYSTGVKPRRNQSHIIYVQVAFALVSIVDVDDVSQSFKCNGFVDLRWTDEILAWDKENESDVKLIYPKVSDVWKPRLILINTLQERDPFEDELSPLWVYPNGSVWWAPGSLFHVSCSMNMTKYPFDHQSCSLFFFAMSHYANELQMFTNTSKARSKFFTINTEWDLIETEIITGIDNDADDMMAVVNFTFHLKRRPYSFMYTVMLPVVLLSLLNFFVFAIPVEAGEQISFGMSVLLAQSVFLTNISSSLPSSIGPLPPATTYLLALLSIAAFTVVVSIIDLYLYRLNQKCFQPTQDNGQNHSSENGADGTNQVRKFSRLDKKRPKWKNVRQWIRISGMAISISSWIAMTALFFFQVLL